MTLAFDAFSEDGVEANSPNWTHTPVGTPVAAIFVASQKFDKADYLTTVTYGGVSMSEVALSPLIKSTGEDGVEYIYHLGASIPTGAQTVAATGTDQPKWGTMTTLTGAGDTEVQDTTSIQSDALDDPSGTLSLGGNSCFCMQSNTSGRFAYDGITPLTNWTNRGSQDWGSNVSFWDTYDVIGTSDVTFGYTTSFTDDVNCLAVAITESAGGASVGLVTKHNPDRGFSGHSASRLGGVLH